MTSDRYKTIMNVGEHTITLAYEDPPRVISPGQEVLVEKPSEGKIIKAAMYAHQMNKRWCELHGDYSQKDWDEAPLWQRESCIAGVRAYAENMALQPQDNHQNWMDYKRAEGWKYGPVKDVEKKEHPCMVPYFELPQEQQAKDHIFRLVVLSVLMG